MRLERNFAGADRLQHYSIPEMAQLLGISKGMCRKLIGARAVSVTRIGRSVRVSKQALIDYAESVSVPAKVA